MIEIIETEETEEQKRKRKKERISAYYDFYQGENSYFGELQKHHNEDKESYLKKLKEDYQNNDLIEKLKAIADTKKVKTEDFIYFDEDDNVDLAYYDEEHDNIDGLKELIKKLITIADTKKVKKALNNLLAEIVPLTDVDGKVLKTMGFKTKYDELIEMYKKRKEYVENAPYSNTDGKNDKSNENDLNENENKNVDKQNEKSQSKSFRLARNNLMVRLFSKQAAEMGLELIDDSDDEAYKKLDEKLNSNSNNEWDNENESEDYDLDYNFDDDLDEYTSDDENENSDLENESDDVYEPESDSEDDYETEEDTDEQQYRYEILRADYIKKIESCLMGTISIIQAIKTISNTDNTINNDDNNDTDNMIVHTLLKLLKNDKNKADIVTLRNVYMANTMYKENIGKSLHDVFLDNDKINEFESDIFDNESSLSDKNKNSIPTPFQFTRFISRLFYIIKNGITPATFNPADLSNKLSSDNLYKKLYIDNTKNDPEALRNYLKELNDAMVPINSNNNEETSKQNEIYDVLKKYLDTIKKKYSDKEHIDADFKRNCLETLNKTKILKPFATKINKIFEFKDKKETKQ